MLDMIRLTLNRMLFLAVFLTLNACSAFDDDSWPTLFDEDDFFIEETQKTATPSSSSLPPSPSRTNGQGFPSETFSPFQQPAPTNTLVGQKVAELRAEEKKIRNATAGLAQELKNMRQGIAQASQVYHGTVGDINARLQVGTTPRNPILVQQHNEAKAQLDSIANIIPQLNNLNSSAANNLSMANFIAESVRSTFAIPGAVDEDHVNLRILQSDVEQTTIVIGRLLQELSIDIRRQNNYIAIERSNLSLLASGIERGEIYGKSLASKVAFSPETISPSPGTSLNGFSSLRTHPLVIIRFDQDNVDYRQTLYAAVNRVVEFRPGASFDIVAVSPSLGPSGTVAFNADKSRKQAEGVLQALVELGLPASQISMHRETDDQVNTNEVRLYVR